MPTRLTGRELETGAADLVVLCVPDRVVHEVAAAIPVGPWIAHTSGARALDALDPHTRRFSLHPLQTFVGHRAEQLDGPGPPSPAERRGSRRGLRLAGLLRLRLFELEDDVRLVTTRPRSWPRASWSRCGAAELMEEADAPPDALLPLMLRTENDFELTGPIIRGDWETIERHLEVIRERRPELEPMYRALTDMMAAAVAAR